MQSPTVKMSKITDYRETLKRLDNWIPYLKKESGLPGPRGNLELAHAVAQEGNKKQFQKLISFEAEENTPEVFLVFCGVMGLGKLSATKPKLFDQLRGYASDPRWRCPRGRRHGITTGRRSGYELALERNAKVEQGQLVRKTRGRRGPG